MMLKQLFATCLLCLATIATCMGQDGRGEVRGDLINDLDQSAVALHPSTPYLEPSTVLLAEIDLSKIDVDATMNWLQETAGVPQSERGNEMIGGFLQSLQGGGVEKVYATAATRSMFDGGPLLILPCDNTAVVSGLASVVLQQVPKEPAQKLHTGDGVVLAGAATAIDRVTGSEGAARPDLILPLKREDRLDHTIVLSLPEEAREELVAFWPQSLPEGSPIQASPRQLIKDIQRIVVSWAMPPEPNVEIVVEATDAGGADRVQQLVKQLLAITGAEAGVTATVKVDVVKIEADASEFSDLIQKLLAPSQKRADQRSKMNAMKMVGLAIHNYYASENHLPPKYFATEDGTPLLSWRVALLPYIEQLAMYRAFNLDKSWNDEANQTQAKTLIPLYCDDPSRGAKTTLRAPVLEGSLWYGDGPPKDFRDVIDGTSNTIAVIDAPEAAAIEWANPQPWIISADDPAADVFGDRDRVTVLMLDGSVRVFTREELDNDKLKAMLTIGGKELIQ